jgi:hypothetical protein
MMNLERKNNCRRVLTRIGEHYAMVVRDIPNAAPIPT